MEASTEGARSRLYSAASRGRGVGGEYGAAQAEGPQRGLRLHLAAGDGSGRSAVRRLAAGGVERNCSSLWPI